MTVTKKPDMLVSLRKLVAELRAERDAHLGPWRDRPKLTLIRAGLVSAHDRKGCGDG